MRQSFVVFVLSSLCAMLLSACGGAGPSASRIAVTSQKSVAQPGSATPGQAEPSLVIEGRVAVSVKAIDGALELIRSHLKTHGGRVVGENESGAGRSWSANLVVRVPPAALDGLLAQLASLGTITNKQINSDDVSKTLFDQEIALTNLTTTLERLRGLVATPGLKMTEILEIEREMTRLRQQIEAIKGERRYLVDRVAFATLNIELRRDGGAVLSPTAKLFPGPRLSTLVLLRPKGSDRVRPGIGATLHFPVPGRLSIDLDLFRRAEGEESAGVMATIGGGFYSDFLGRGRRRFLNPYLGMRLGYGYLEASAAVVAAEAGVELVKTSRFLLDTNVRASALLGAEARAGVVFGLSGVVAF